MAKPKYYKANQGFSTTFEGEPLFVQKGELVSADHPLLKGREELFDPTESFGRFDTASEVEQATAVPGEKRTLPARAKRAKRSTAKAAPVVSEKPSFGLTTKDIQPGSTREPADA